MQSQEPANYVPQVGGDWYDRGNKADQHWDLMDRYNVSYLEACATKYLMRWRDKDGLRDLKKSRSYVEKRIKQLKADAEEHNNADFLCPSSSRRFHIPALVLLKWLRGNAVSNTEQDACLCILLWDKAEDLQSALTNIDFLIQQAEENGHA